MQSLWFLDWTRTDRQQKALTDVAIGKGFLIWFLSLTSRRGTLFTCNPPGIQNDAAYGERYQIVIKRGAQNRGDVVPQWVQSFKNSFPLVQSKFLIFPLIPMLYGFSIPACSANCSADLKENRRRAEQATFPLPALSALYPYYFFLSSSFCMLFSSLFAISLPYLSVLSSFSS